MRSMNCNAFRSTDGPTDRPTTGPTDRRTDRATLSGWAAGRLGGIVRCTQRKQRRRRRTLALLAHTSQISQAMLPPACWFGLRTCVRILAPPVDRTDGRTHERMRPSRAVASVAATRLVYTRMSVASAAGGRVTHGEADDVRTVSSRRRQRSGAGQPRRCCCCCC